MLSTDRSRTRHALLYASLTLALVASLTAGCSEKSTSSSTSAGKSAATVTTTECTADSVVECAPTDTTIDDLLPDAPVVADGTPIKVGMINTDTGPTNAFPELTRGTETGVRWINEELGGVDSHTIELVPCDVKFSATGSPLSPPR